MTAYFGWSDSKVERGSLRTVTDGSNDSMDAMAVYPPPSPSTGRRFSSSCQCCEPTEMHCRNAFSFYNQDRIARQQVHEQPEARQFRVASCHAQGDDLEPRTSHVTRPAAVGLLHRAPQAATCLKGQPDSEQSAGVLHQDDVANVPRQAVTTSPVVENRAKCRYIQERIFEIPRVEYIERIEFDDQIEYREVLVDRIVEVPTVITRAWAPGVEPRAIQQNIGGVEREAAPTHEVQGTLASGQLPSAALEPCAWRPLMRVCRRGTWVFIDEGIALEQCWVPVPIMSLHDAAAFPWQQAVRPTACIYPP
eukprot:TRINITY_DN92167_c0_g1_i1.p1 TRINITY_DN92167_c0_g1~~TRINITY_DN92167_c0_g1_i1.p1  ORF type:complete len:307 (+),score=15.35 TRINITY_DN92167_c0_g1_i1:22-942(+)